MKLLEHIRRVRRIDVNGTPTVTLQTTFQDVNSVYTVFFPTADLPFVEGYVMRSTFDACSKCCVSGVPLSRREIVAYIIHVNLTREVLCDS